MIEHQSHNYLIKKGDAWSSSALGREEQKKAMAKVAKLAFKKREKVVVVISLSLFNIIHSTVLWILNPPPLSIPYIA